MRTTTWHTQCVVITSFVEGDRGRGGGPKQMEKGVGKSGAPGEASSQGREGSAKLSWKDLEKPI